MLSDFRESVCFFGLNRIKLSWPFTTCPTVFTALDLLYVLYVFYSIITRLRLFDSLQKYCGKKSRGRTPRPSAVCICLYERDDFGKLVSE